MQERDKEKKEFGDLETKQAQHSDQSTSPEIEKQAYVEVEYSEINQPSVETESEELQTVESPLVLTENTKVLLTDTSKWDFAELEKEMEKQKNNDAKVFPALEIETLIKQNHSNPETALSSMEKSKEESIVEESLIAEEANEESILEESSIAEKANEESKAEEFPVANTSQEHVSPSVEAVLSSSEITESSRHEKEGELETSQDVEKSIASVNKEDEIEDQFDETTSGNVESETKEESFLLHVQQITRNANPNPEKNQSSTELELSTESAATASIEVESRKSHVKSNSVEATHVQKNKTKKWFVGVLAALFVSGGVYLWATQDHTNFENPIQALTPEKKLEPQKIMLTASGKSFELDLLTIGYDGKDPASVDQTKLLAWLDEVKSQVDIPMKNAYQKKVSDSITPEQAGSVVDVKAVKQWLTDYTTLVNQSKELPMVTVEPQITTEDLKAASGKLVGSYRTTFDAGNVNRTTNIKLASKKIDGLVLLPGKEFSFNKVVGERTAGRGYKPAHVIVNGEFSEGIGGGICQVSSTLFNSVDEANLRITRRQSHSKEVTYVPPGRDATVSWGGPDFRFKNNLNKPIVIRIIVKGGSITVNTYTAPGAKVTKKKIQPPPVEKFSEITVDGTKPNEVLPVQPTTP